MFAASSGSLRFCFWIAAAFSNASPASLSDHHEDDMSVTPAGPRNIEAGQMRVLSFCTLKAFAACVYKSAAFSYFSVRPPKKLNPLEAPCSALSA